MYRLPPKNSLPLLGIPEEEEKKEKRFCAETSYFAIVNSAKKVIYIQTPDTCRPATCHLRRPHQSDSRFPRPRPPFLLLAPHILMYEPPFELAPNLGFMLNSAVCGFISSSCTTIFGLLGPCSAACTTTGLPLPFAPMAIELALPMGPTYPVP